MVIRRDQNLFEISGEKYLSFEESVMLTSGNKKMCTNPFLNAKHKKSDSNTIAVKIQFRGILSFMLKQVQYNNDGRAEAP